MSAGQITTVNGSRCTLVKRSTQAVLTSNTSPPPVAVTTSLANTFISSPNPEQSVTAVPFAAGNPQNSAVLNPTITTGLPSSLPVFASSSSTGGIQTPIPDIDPQPTNTESSSALPPPAGDTSSTAGAASPAISHSSGDGHDGDGSHKPSDHDSSGASKAGIAVGVALGLLLIVAAITIAWYFWRRRRRNRDSTATTLISSESKARSDASSIGPSSRLAFEFASLKATLQDRWLAVASKLRSRGRTSFDTGRPSSADLSRGINETTIRYSPPPQPSFRTRAATFASIVRNNLRHPKRASTSDAALDRDRTIDWATSPVRSISNIPTIPPTVAAAAGARRSLSPMSPISDRHTSDPFSDENSLLARRSTSQRRRHSSSFSAAGPNPFAFHRPFSRQAQQRQPNTNANANPFADPSDPFLDPQPPAAALTVRNPSESWTPHHRHDSSSVIVLPSSDSQRGSKETTASELMRWQKRKEREESGINGGAGIGGIGRGGGFGRDTMNTTKSNPFDLEL